MNKKGKSREVYSIPLFPDRGEAVSPEVGCRWPHPAFLSVPLAVPARSIDAGKSLCFDILISLYSTVCQLIIYTKYLEIRPAYRVIIRYSYGLCLIIYLLKHLSSYVRLIVMLVLVRYNLDRIGSVI